MGEWVKAIKDGIVIFFLRQLLKKRQNVKW